MKMKELKFPYLWQDRKPLLKEGVLFVPRYYFKHSCFVMPEFSDPTLFGNSNPVHIEFCSGNGQWIAEKAKASPGVNFIALEMRIDRVEKIWGKKCAYSLDNLIIVCGDARDFMDHYLKNGSLSGAYMNFPDPWPKDRHEKHRLIQPPFVAAIADGLQVGATFTLVTDHIEYAEHSIRILSDSPHFQSKFPAPFYKKEWPGYGSSWFERLWLGKGKEIHYIHYEKHE